MKPIRSSRPEVQRSRWRRWLARISWGLTTLVLPMPLLAQSAADSVSFTLDEVVVTGSRVPVERGRIPQKLEIIGDSELERIPAQQVAEVLRRTIPVEVIEYPGLLSGVSMRGFRPEYTGTNPRTLILVDGRPAGTNNLALLPLGEIARIEVLRGPASALYGASAMAGVINVIRRRSEQAWSGQAHAGYGSLDDYEVRLAAGGALPGGFDLDLGLSEVGQRSGYPTGSTRSFGADSLVKILPDGRRIRLPWTGSDTIVSFGEYRTRSGHGRLGYALGEEWKLEIRGELYRADGVQNPGDLGASWDGRSVKDVGRYSMEAALFGVGPTPRPSLRLYSVEEGVDYFDRADPPHHVNFRTPVHTYGAQLQHSIGWQGHQFTLGADYAAAEARSEAFTPEGGRRAPYAPDTGTHALAGFGQASTAWLGERLFLTAGARLDRVAFHVRETLGLEESAPNSEHHLVLTPSLGGRYALGGGIQLYGNLGRAFITPEAFQVAGYSEQRTGEHTIHRTRGNPALKPETSRSWDAGVRLERPREGFEFEVTYFDTRVRDRITSRVTQEGAGTITIGGDTIVATTEYLNADAATIRGVEASTGLELFTGAEQSVRVVANATRILKAEEHLQASAHGQRIRNVATLTLLLGVDYERHDRFGARLSGRYVGERADADYLDWATPGEILYPAHLVFDLAGSYQIGPQYRLSLEMRNLLDEDYFEIRGYNLPGRSLRVGIGARF